MIYADTSATKQSVGQASSKMTTLWIFVMEASIGDWPNGLAYTIDDVGSDALVGQHLGSLHRAPRRVARMESSSSAFLVPAGSRHVKTVHFARTGLWLKADNNERTPSDFDVPRTATTKPCRFELAGDVRWCHGPDVRQHVQHLLIRQLAPKAMHGAE
jgi:hypothetical protein